MGSELYKTLYFLGFRPLVRDRCAGCSVSAQGPHSQPQQNRLQVCVQSVGTVTLTHSEDPSHLSAPHQVPGGRGSAEHSPTQPHEFDESMKPNKPLSSWVWPGQSGFQGASDVQGPEYETHCWRPRHGLWDAPGPSLLETPREPGFLQHPKRPGGLLQHGTVQLPAMTPLNTNMSVHQRSWGALLHAVAHHDSPARACLCIAREQNLLWRKPRWITARLGGRKMPQQAIAHIFVLLNAFYCELYIPCKISGWVFGLGFFFGGSGGVIFMKNP